MAGQHAQQNTNPSDLGRKLQVSGPLGFIAAVHQTLGRLGRPYYFADCVPDFLLANKTGLDPAAYEAAYSASYGGAGGAGADGAGGEGRFVATPHAVVHQYRKRPAKLFGRGTADTSGHLRRQTAPHEAHLHDQALPDVEPDEHVQPWMGDGRRPPLWDSIDHVPDLIRDEVLKNPLMHVTTWHYDVYVDFVCVASTGTWAEQMVTDLEYILHTFHHRSATGGSNLHGWHVETVVGAPPAVEKKLWDGAVARTITWRLRQVVGHALPAHVVEEINVDLYGRQETLGI